MNLDADFPEKLGFLFEPARYKVAYGGRGSAKSWSFARALILEAAARPTRVLCAREYQASIADSVHTLLSDQISNMGLNSMFASVQKEIRGSNGSLFSFAGLKQNISSLKSYEGYDRVWIEEAANVSRNSWRTLIPTIRKEGSEIWVTFNPELESDETYQRFIVRPPEDAVVAKINHSDNPWFPEVLRKEMEQDKERNYDEYLHIWEGHCIQALEGAIYADEMRQTASDNRITRVPYDPAYPVHRFWDLGWADNTSIWLAQFVGLDIRIINHVSGSRRKISDYLIDMQQMRYVFGEDWLPHDGAAGNAASGGRSVSQILKEAGCDVYVLPRTASVVAEINRVRELFPRMWFDQEHCADGLQSLRRYCWNTDDEGTTKGRMPKHDAASHDADALRALAAAINHVSYGNDDYDDYDDSDEGRSSVAGY